MSQTHVLVDGLVLRPPMGGALRYAQAILPHMAQLGRAADVRVTLLLSNRPNWSPEALSAWETAGVHLAWRAEPMHPAWRRALREGHALHQTLRALEQAGTPAQIVQTQSLPGIRIPGLAHVHLCHGLRRVETGPAWQRGLAYRSLGRALETAHSVLAVSQTLASQLNPWVPPAKVHVATPGSEHLAVLPRDPASHVLWIGPATPHKNLALVLEAWSRNPDLPPLRLRGLDTKAAQSAGAQDPRVHREPACEASEVAHALAHCAALVLPSRLESFGLLALEALAAGTPLALSDLPAHREVVGAAQHLVHWFDPDDAQACAQAVRAAVLDQDASRAAERRHRATAFSWRASAEATLAVWKAALPMRD
ncbi:MAG: glycosyltransferase [Planctomycetes bacterium]|nr:glycosyltransferase [Planctomycetota bacterium]MCB9908874.1 glycosyltransferase [Planctomycetota bacterium]HPF14278.1 glycosyltransferase [Planctomycetota bacterium]